MQMLMHFSSAKYTKYRLIAGALSGPAGGRSLSAPRTTDRAGRVRIKGGEREERGKGREEKGEGRKGRGRKGKLHTHTCLQTSAPKTPLTAALVISLPLSTICTHVSVLSHYSLILMPCIID